VLENWERILGNITGRDTGFIVLEHDLFQQSVQVATGYILPDALAHNPPFTIQPVISCIDMPLANAYIETNDNVTNPPARQSAAEIFTGATVAIQATGAAKGAAVSLSSNAVAGTLILGTISLISGYFTTRI
jgi:hypothetical protein